MTTYDGPATVIASGTEYPVTAVLDISTRGTGNTWHGVITAEDEYVAWEIFNDEDTQLRIEDRLPGGFTAGSFDAAKAELKVRGQGLVPFGF
ncbi:hypothetical protein [Streptomyces sp. KL116D]|uniref:hypothetical protein n=1 Tax=Streptomyces sp. KL116D TaxID=3045152 RepID=UPI003556E3A4